MNEIIKKDTQKIAIPQKSITLSGPNSNYMENIEHVEKIDNSTNISYPMYLVDAKNTKKIMELPSYINTKFYNLIVSTAINEDIELKTINMPIDRVIKNYYTDIDDVDTLARLDKNALNHLYSFPTIFAPEAVEYHGKTDDSQMCYVGFIKRIKNTRTDVTITLNYLWKFPYKCVEVLAEPLEIQGMDIAISELNHTHWAIKQIDLIGTLSNHGVSLLGLYSKEKI